MKNVLLTVFVACFVLMGISAGAQSTMIEISIIKNGTPVTDTLENGQVVTYDTSSDDAEQENDEMDALYDDDLDAGWEGEPDDQNILTTGLRFQNVAIPHGATIDSAYLILNSHEEKTTEDVAIITIVGEATDDAETYGLESLITDRPETTAKVVWTCNEDWGLWTYHQTPDIAHVIQEIVDRDGWAYGNALAIMMKGENQGPSDLENAREFESFENIADPEDGGDGQNHPERRPVLRVYYSFPSTIFETYIKVNGDPVTDTLENGQVVTYDTSSDDAEQENNEMDALYDDDLDAGWEGEPDDQNILNSGLRFRDISIPTGVTIDSAFLVLTSHEEKTAMDVANLTIVGEASDHAETYDLDNLITGRPETEAMVYWQCAEDWGLWTTHRTPDISGIIQEIIDRDGWQSGNPIAIMIKGENQGPSDLENAREFESFENIADPEDGGDGQNHPERRPKLVIYFSGSSSIGEAYANVRTLNVFPNPSSGSIIYLILEQHVPAQVYMYDQSGKQVISENFNGSESRISVDISTLTNGVYVVKAAQGNYIYTQKLIINR